jgi:DNA mismatch repair protein MutS
MNNKQTPMFEQYNSIKKDNPDCLLFFRLGDFYELFGDDAVMASKELGLVLTKRQDVPMCGIPWHAHEMYLAKLVKNGHRIAICDQTETPEEAKKRGYKTIVERKVTRIVTGGTLIEESMLDDKSNNFLLAISNELDGKLGIAYADISTGSFFVEETESSDIASIISRISPSEIICPDKLLSQKEFISKISVYKSIIHALPCAKFMNISCMENLTSFFGVKFIDSFGDFSKNLIEAASEIVEYIRSMHPSSNISLSTPRLIKSSEFMYLDHFTRKSLEISTSVNGKSSCILYNLDKTLTPGGHRLLSLWLMNPLIDTWRINERLDYVEFFIANKDILSEVRNVLKHFPDCERALSRIVINKARPRDLKTVLISIQKSIALEELISKFDNLRTLTFSFQSIEKIQKILEQSIVDSPPLLARDGGFIKSGYDAGLDEYRNLLDNGEYIIQKMQQKYAAETGIPSLKIKNNGVLGYFIEISPNYVSKIPYTFIHRQTLGSVIRYTSKELSEIANKIYSASSNAKYRELEIFEEIIKEIVKFADDFKVVFESVSFLDVVSSLSLLAIENGYTRPTFTNDKTIDIKNGRHIVVENNLKSSGAKFVANDCFMSDGSEILILTGPNMGGKSTYLRMNAIIIIMAQIGSFVPADEAVIGIVDRIFSRVGASDDISAGKSTFMIEMLETATILRQATDRSFVILDEVGRGTSTYDGLAIAWAVVEELGLSIRVRTIFATHYHELINIKNTVQSVRFLNVKVEEWNEKIIFLHKIVDGFANKSYGIHVASLAGFPNNVINRAKELLNGM